MCLAVSEADIGSVDVGGLSAQQAKAKLQQDLLGELETPVTVTRGTREGRMGPGQSKVAVNIDGSVDAALAKSNQANFVVRAYRKLSGTSVDATVTPEVQYSRPAVNDLVNEVAKDVDRKAKDAALRFTVTAVAPGPPR